MKTEPEVEAEVARIDSNINHVRASLQATDDLILKLTRLQANRREYLRKLGAERSEIQTYELDLGIK